MNRPQPRLILCLAVSLTFSPLARGAAIAGGLEGVSLGPEAFQARPGELINVLFEVTNTTGNDITAATDAILPEGWKVVNRPGPLRLAPSARAVFIFSVVVPSAARAATYEAAFRVFAQEAPSMSYRHGITVTVQEVQGLTVNLVEAPRTVVSGGLYAASFLVKNTGNDTVVLALSCSSLGGIPAVVDVDRVELAPGQSHVARVTARIPEDIPRGFTHRLFLEARSIGPRPLAAQGWADVEVIRSGTPFLERFTTIPATLTLRQATQHGGKTASSLQAALEAQGPVDKAGKHHVELVLVGPDTTDETTFGTQDQYLFRAYSETYDVVAGDSQFSLSPLTEQYLAARGAGLGLSLGGLSVKGFSARPRWQEPDVTETGVSLGYRFGSSLDVTLNALGKSGEDEDAKVASAQVSIRPLPWMDMDIEGAQGNGGDTKGEAVRASVSCAGPPGSARLSYLDADPDFPGYHKDKRLASLDLVSNISKPLRASLSFNREERNLRREPDIAQAPVDTRTRLGVDYLADDKTTYSLAVSGRRLEDRLPSPLTDFTEVTMRAGVRKQLPSASCNVFAETGGRRDETDGEVSPLWQVALTAYGTRDRDLSFGLHARVASKVNIDPANARTVSAGASVACSFSRETRIELSGQVDADRSDASRNKYLLEASVKKDLWQDSTLTARASRTLYTGHTDTKNETALLVEYAHEFGLPVARKAGTSTVSGIVRDASSSKPLGGVILRLDGRSAATDPEGRFSFLGLTPGTAYLGVDVSGLDPTSLPDCQNPLPLTLEAGRVILVEILITKKATLRGRIEIYKAFKGERALPTVLEGELLPRQEGAIELRPAAPLANALVELRGTGGTVRALTDAHGLFTFPELRPGTWTLAVSREAIPEDHVLEPAELTFELAPGDAREVALKVLPKKRVIRFMQEGGRVIQEEAR